MIPSSFSSTGAAVGAWLLLTSLSAGCSRTPTEQTPVGALRLFVQAMQRTDWDADAPEQAYRLLAPEDRQHLQRLASQAEAVGGQELEPWDMLVTGKFRPRLALRASNTHAEVQGNRAMVEVYDGKGDRKARVPMVREGRGWRVELGVADAL